MGTGIEASDMGSAEPHVMDLPGLVVVGHGLVDLIASKLAELSSSRRVFLATSPTPYRVLGERIEERLRDLGVEVDVAILQEEEPEPSGPTLIAGVGGGRVIDWAKSMALRLGLRYVSIPTIASHDGIASPMFSGRMGGAVRSSKARMPACIFVDMDVIASSPRRYTSSGVGDLVAKYTAVRDWRLGAQVTGEYFGEYAAALAELSSRVVMRSAAKIGAYRVDGLRVLVEALISAGVSMGIAGSSRPCSGAEHLISHALEMDGLGDALHGERCGVATIYTAYLHGARWGMVLEALRLANAPSTLREIGVDQDAFADAVLKAPSLRRDRYTILHHLKPRREEVIDALNRIGLG